MRTQNLIPTLSFLTLSSLALIGCGHSYVVVKQAAPNPLVGQTKLTAVAPTFEGLTVGKMKEADYVAKKTADKKTPEEAEKWKNDFEGDKKTLADKMAARVSERMAAAGLNIDMTGTGGFTIKSNFYYLEPGNFNGFVNIPTEVKLDVQVLDDKGGVVDDVQFRSVVAAGTFNPAVSQRVAAAGVNLADQLLRYLQSRTAAAK